MLRIQRTDNYSLFNIHSQNRIVTEKNLPEALINSIREKNMLESNPIKCDKNMYVIDGQHRLEVAKFLKVPIYFVIDENLTYEDIPKFQIQKSWNIRDYLRYYRNEKMDYLFIEDIINKYQLSNFLPIVVELCGSMKEATRHFRKGTYKITKDKRKLEDNFNKIHEIQKEIKKQNKDFVYTSNGIKALWILVNEKGYNHETMKYKINKFIDNVMTAFNFKKRDSIADHLVHAVYNYFTKDGDKLRQD